MENFSASGGGSAGAPPAGTLRAATSMTKPLENDTIHLHRLDISSHAAVQHGTAEHRRLRRLSVLKSGLRRLAMLWKLEVQIFRA